MSKYTKEELAGLSPEQLREFERLSKGSGEKSATEYIRSIYDGRVSSSESKKIEEEKEEREEIKEAEAQAEQNDPRTDTTENLNQVVAQTNFIARSEVANDKINVLIRTASYYKILEDGVEKTYSDIHITFPNTIGFAHVTNVEFLDAGFASNLIVNTNNATFYRLRFDVDAYAGYSSEQAVRVTWENGWEKVFNLFIPFKNPFKYSGDPLADDFYGQYHQGTTSCEQTYIPGDYASTGVFYGPEITNPNHIVLDTPNKTLHQFTRVVEDPAGIWDGVLPWVYFLEEDFEYNVAGQASKYLFQFRNFDSLEALGSVNAAGQIAPYFWSNDLNLYDVDTGWEVDNDELTLGITGYSVQEQQVQFIQTYSEPVPTYLRSYQDISNNFGLFSVVTTSQVLQGSIEPDSDQSNFYQAYSPSLLFAWQTNDYRWLANEMANAISYDDWIANLDTEESEGQIVINTGDLTFPNTSTPVNQVVIPTGTRGAPSMGWTQYSKNLNPCAGDIPTFYVCSELGNTNDYNTTGLDCDGNPIPAAYLNGSLSANFVTTDCCTFDCQEDSFLAEFNDVTAASYNTSNGSFKFTIFDNDGDGIADSGFPTTTGGSQFTIALSAEGGSTITQTMPASVGTSTGISCITNTTAATAHQVTLAGGAQSDLISPGMQVTGTGIPDGTFVGSIITGTVGADGASGVSKFTLVSVTGEQVSATAAATNTLQFSMGYSIEFGSLPADTYTVTVTNSESCVYTRATVINEMPAPEGCTDSGAINYDSTAVNDDNSCIFCNSSTGNIEDVSGNLVEEGLSSSFTVDTLQIVTNPLAGNNTGEIKFGFSLYPIVTTNLTSTMSYTMTLFSHPTLADSQGFTSGTQVAQQTGLAVPTHTFTGLGYGFYSVRLEIEDSSTGSDAGLEKCFSRSAGIIPANVCADSQSTTFADYQGIPSDLWAHEVNLCSYDCTTTAYLEVGYDQDIPCNPVLLQVVVDYENVAVGEFGQVGTSDMQILWYQNGNLVETFAQGGVFGNGQLINILSSPQLGWGPVVPGVNYYEAVVTITNADTGQTCTVIAASTYTIPLCGCIDGDPNTNGGVALNYDPLATIDDGSCIYQSFNCNTQTFQCTDPLDGTGTFQDYNTCMQNACTPDVIDCFDSLADNYNPNTTIPDNSLCIYSACLDPNSIQINGQYGMYYNCDGQYLPSATVAQNTCCIYCAGNEPVTFNATTTNATVSSDCITNSDGSFSIYAYNSNVLGCPTWAIEIYDANGPIALDPNTSSGIANNAVFNTGNILPAGAYTYTVRDECYGCSVSGTFFITADVVTCGCTDPNADNYDPNATSDDGSCVYCGCTDPLANNYDPNAVCDDGSCEYTIPVNPCQLDASQANKILGKINDCVANKGLSYLNKLKTGLADDCSIMNTWKLILIDYLLKSHGGELDCLYNCQDGLTPDEIQNNQTCAELLAEGGPTTGLNDAGYPGSTYTLGTGTVITDPNAYFVVSTIVYEGDVIQMPSGNIYIMADGGNCTQGCYNPESAQGQQSGHWQLCQNNTTFTFTDADTTTEASIAYLDKFINFANKFCADCGTDFIAQ